MWRSAALRRPLAQRSLLSASSRLTAASRMAMQSARRRPSWTHERVVRKALHYPLSFVVALERMVLEPCVLQAGLGPA